jgi:hypothetical protein
MRSVSVVGTTSFLPLGRSRPMIVAARCQRSPRGTRRRRWWSVRCRCICCKLSSRWLQIPPRGYLRNSSTSCENVAARSGSSSRASPYALVAPPSPGRPAKCPPRAGARRRPLPRPRAACRSRRRPRTRGEPGGPRRPSRPPPACRPSALVAPDARARAGPNIPSFHQGAYLEAARSPRLASPSPRAVRTAPHSPPESPRVNPQNV